MTEELMREMAGNRKFEVAFIYLAPGADPANDRFVKEGALERTTFVAVPDDAAAARVAAELAEGGLDDIELFGGLGAPAAAAVIQAVDGRAPVGYVAYDDPRADSARDTAVIYVAAGADPAVDREVGEHDGKRTTFVAVPDPAAAVSAARMLVDEGVEQIELCGVHGPVPTAQAVEAVGGRVPVGGILFGVESVDGVADFKARYAARIAEVTEAE